MAEPALKHSDVSSTNQRALFNRRIGFTLVELLIVIGIVALLIAILLVSLSRVRLSALRLRDQNNLRQLAQSARLYAESNRGVWPIGSRIKSTAAAPPAGDDIRWIGRDSFVFFLSSMGHSAAAQQWLLGTPLTQQQATVISCISAVGNAVAMQNDVGRMDLFNTPEYAGTMLGYNYWAGRDPTVAGQVFDPLGNPLPGVFYQFAKKVTDRSTSRVLFSCPNYIGPAWGCELPHARTADRFILTAPDATVTSPVASVYLPMEGMFFAYDDASVQWVSRKSLWSMHEGDNGVPNAGFQWVYFDGDRR